jgi:hypothetical protein
VRRRGVDDDEQKLHRSANGDSVDDLPDPLGFTCEAQDSVALCL